MSLLHPALQRMLGVGRMRLDPAAGGEERAEEEKERKVAGLGHPGSLSRLTGLPGLSEENEVPCEWVTERNEVERTGNEALSGWRADGDSCESLIDQVSAEPKL
jgi:hypothetical protein